MKSIPDQEWVYVTAPDFTEEQAFRYALDRLADPNATGHELTVARLGLDPYRDTIRARRLRRELAIARHRADARDGLRPNGHRRTPTALGYAWSEGPNHAA
jgi:hypothetical protein